jgi:arabinan endo-1,5-alpha-L-arabinosidase
VLPGSTVADASPETLMKTHGAFTISLAAMLAGLSTRGCSEAGNGNAPESSIAPTRPGGSSDGEGNGSGERDAGALDGDAAAHTMEAGADAALPPPVPYANPVLDADFPDPTVIRGADKKLYAFATGGLIQRAKSVDLVHWQKIGDAMASKPSWANMKNFFWAPHVVEHGGTFYLYFAAEQNAGSGSMCIGVATATAPDATFADVGAPIVCGPGFANIDAMVYDDPNTGKALLYWGSAFESIRVQELAPDRIHLAPGSQPQALLVPSAYAYERLIEAPWLHPHGGKFYLFSSGDDCCGAPGRAPHYAVMVARALSPTGPYEDLAPSIGAPDNTILVANAAWTAPGHNAIIVDDAGDDWMIYHAVASASPGARRMLIDKISYASGWPTIAGHSPSQGMQTGPVFRQ